MVSDIKLNLVSKLKTTEEEVNTYYNIHGKFPALKLAISLDGGKTFGANEIFLDGNSLLHN